MTFARKTEDSNLQPMCKADRVYVTLRQRIRDLELQPGQPLRKDELGAEFGVSRAPISEALMRLAEEGLVDVFPQHGSFVAAIRKEDVREGMFIRMGFETEAVRCIARAASPEQLTSLDANLDAQSAALLRNDLHGFYELDEAFHELLFRHVGHRRAQHFLDAARAQLDRIRRFVLTSKGRPQATLDEHRRIVEAIRMQDPEFAAAAMRAHLTSVSHSVERQLELLGSQSS